MLDSQYVLRHVGNACRARHRFSGNGCRVWGVDTSHGVVEVALSEAYFGGNMGGRPMGTII